MSAWTDLGVTVLATWPPAAAAFVVNWYKTKNHVAAVAQQQTQDITAATSQTVASVTSQAVASQNADFQKIAEQAAAQAAEKQTKQLLETWPVTAQNPQIEAAAEAAAPAILAAGTSIVKSYIIAPAKRHVDAWLAQNHIDPSTVVRVTNPDTLDALDGALVVVLNPSALSGPAAEAAEKARELDSAGKVTLRTDQT